MLKTDKITTKLRVVFDGSAATSSGMSLNEIMMRDPRLQSDLRCIFLRFCLHSIAITTDVMYRPTKKYRKVSVFLEDCELQ